MRFGALPALVVLGASLVAANPIRVVVTEVSTGGRFDHAAVAVTPPFSPAVAQPIHVQPIHAVDSTKPNRRPCGGMRGKALDASNTLRQWLGLDPIIHVEPVKLDNPSRPHMHHAHHMEGMIVKEGGKPANALPVLPFVGTPVRPAFVSEGEMMMPEAEGEGRWPDQQHARRPMWIHRHQHLLHASFLRRVHHALMSLGPWEGRAVAFVLGCGIGVLLRMAWVLVLVTARAFKGSRDDDETEYDVVFDESEMLVPPPQYTIIQGTEAVPVPVDEKSDKDTHA